MSDNNSNNDLPAEQESASARISAIPDSVLPEGHSTWSTRLWDDGWNGEAGMFGAANLCVATKKWADGTEDVLIAHALGFEESTPAAYAHRHGEGVTPLTAHGPANDVVRTVTGTWGRQKREAKHSGTLEHSTCSHRQTDDGGPDVSQFIVATVVGASFPTWPGLTSSRSNSG